MKPFIYWKSLSLLEKIWLAVSLGALGAALLFFFGDALFDLTQKIPAPGGTLTEGLLGQPRFINPVLAALNPVDQELTRLIYPSLLRPGPDGKLEKYLASELSISENLKEFRVAIPAGINWSDRVPITSEDVVFTIQLIQDPAFNSPLRGLWEGVRAEATGPQEVRFTLSEPYAFFPENLTFGVLPKHIWEQAAPEKFPLHKANLEPIGAGPYKIKKVITEKDAYISSIELEPNPEFWGQAPWISTLKFRFYSLFPRLLQDLASRKIDAGGNIPPQFYQPVRELKNLKIYGFDQLLYFALFFNSNQQPLFAKKAVREALGLAIDRPKLIKEVWNRQAALVDSPLPPAAQFAVQPDSLAFDPRKAQKLWEQSGTQDLKIELTILAAPSLEATAEFIRASWEKNLGLKVSLLPVEPEKFSKDILEPRSFEVLLLGQALKSIPDPFSFWHSTQGSHPGLNIAGYKSLKIDRLLEEVRQIQDPEIQSQKFQEFQETLTADLPVIFLYSPKFIYAVDKKVKGISGRKVLSQPGDRFSDIENWFINVQRVYR